MLIQFTEPMQPRYIHINPVNNRVHLLVPLVEGQEISTNNTCQSTKTLDAFFKEGAALRELNTYKSALEFDLQLVADGSPLQVAKQERLKQIQAYIDGVSAIGTNYLSALTSLMQTPSNLYSIQLRPRKQDSFSRVVNPVFNIERRNDATGTPLSALYNAMYAIYPNTKIVDPQARLKQAVIAELPKEGVTFKIIQRVLTEQCQRLFSTTVNFTETSDGSVVDQAYIDGLMAFTSEAPGTTDDYIFAILRASAMEMWVSLPTAPFYSVEGNLSEENKTEKLSILTQFFLGVVNIHCAANDISHNNFGKILDASPDLSGEVAGIVTTAVSTGADVEECLCTFFNEHASEFGLTRQLSPIDIAAITQKFSGMYKTITATKENPHTDDFMMLDTTTRTGKFVTHQGSICTDFAELVVPAELDNEYFQTIREDFEAPHDCFISHKNEAMQASIELSIEELLSHINDDEQFDKLPINIKQACMNSPVFQLRTFLHDVAKGKQDEAELLLTDNPRAQALLSTPGTFTDYSGRTFNCTAYEYAYWAKDTYMCRMLERHMDGATKASMFARINEIERIDALTGQPVGLAYHQGGLEHRSAHFDLTPLISALQRYVDGYDSWERTYNWVAMKAAWMEVGLEQCDMPVHVLNEYCHPDRSFNPRPEFNEEILPRNIRFFNYNTGVEEPLFPLVISDSSGLGADFALTCLGFVGGGVWEGRCGRGSEGGRAGVDLAAVSHLDEVRTGELRQLLENLRPADPEPRHGMHL